MLSAVCTISDRTLSRSLATDDRMLSAVCTISDRTLSISLATSNRMLSAVCVISECSVTISPSASVTLASIPCPSTVSSATRLQLGPPLESVPATASATRLTCSSVSTIQAWSSPSFLAPYRAPRLPARPLCRRIPATSANSLLSVTVTRSGSRTRSAHSSLTIRASTTAPLSGSGTRHTRLTPSRSSVSPVVSLSSSPLMVTVTTGSSCRLSNPCAQSRNTALSLILWSVSTLSTRPKTDSFSLIMQPPSICRSFWPTG